MKAPEKIYISTLNVGDNHYSISKTENPANKKYEVEYTRTNAFIEKAEEFIYSALNEGIIGTANIEDFMRLFKKYMEE